MSKLDTLVIKGQIKAMQAKDKLEETLTNKLSKLSGDSQLVVALVLIAVAVGLCILFRQKLQDIMKNLFTTITAAIEKLAAGTVTPIE